MKLSKGQIRALETVAAGKVWDEKKKTTWLLHPAGIRSGIIFDLEDLGFIEKQSATNNKWLYILTKTGKEALEESEKG